MLYVQQGFTPLGSYAQLLGSGPDKWLAAGIIQSSMIIDLRTNILPSFLHSFKLARERGIALRPLMALIAACIVITYTLGVWQGCASALQRGRLAVAWHIFARLAKAGGQRIAGTIAPGAGHELDKLAMAGGGRAENLELAMDAQPFFMVSFASYRTAIISKHPMFLFWFSIFLGWLCKVLTTRFGGTSVYRQVTPAFLGLIPGDVATMFWLVIDGW